MTAKCAICLAFLAASTLFLVVTTDKSVSDILVYLPFKRKTLENSYNYYAHTSQTSENSHPHIPPRLAYVISGSKGDGMRMKRLLQALYHPRNQYVLHLDFESSIRERVDVSRYVRLDPMFVKMRNVHFISKANLITYKGPTMIACTLHAAAILLKKSKDWDWFINLSASDYPLVTQDDLLHVLSYLPRDLNFIDHTSILAWKENHRAKPIIIDPGLYTSKKADIFWVSQRRQLPTSFHLFTGSAWMMLTRTFMEYCIWGWDNLPRILLLYYSNFISSPEGYFHTIICNSKEFQNTTVNNDMHFIMWDTPPKQHPLSLTIQHLANMTQSGAPFARKFGKDDPVLDRIDEVLLRRTRGSFTPGAWCIGEEGQDPCSQIGDIGILSPGTGSKRLEKLLLKLLSTENFRPKQCRV